MALSREQPSRKLRVRRSDADGYVDRDMAVPSNGLAVETTLRVDYRKDASTRLVS